MTRTLLAFMERMRSRKSSRSAMRTNSRALSTIPSGLSPKRLVTRSEREPWLVPMRIERPRVRHFSTRGEKRSSTRRSSASYSASVYSRAANFRLSAKLPGLTRTLSAKSAARSAASGLKWMSATRGTSQPFARSASRMRPRASASFTVGVVRRTMSQPASTRRSVWATLASTSWGSGVVIDWMEIGAPPPTVTRPTFTARVLLLRYPKGSSQ